MLMNKLATLVLLNSTLMLVLALLVLVYGLFTAWMRTRARPLPNPDPIGPPIWGALRIIGTIWMFSGCIYQGWLHFWADPWPITDAYSNYDLYIALWIREWLVIMLPGTPMLYQLSERWSMWGKHAALWRIMSTTLALLAGILAIATSIGVRLFA